LEASAMSTWLFLSEPVMCERPLPWFPARRMVFPRSPWAIS